MNEKSQTKIVSVIVESSVSSKGKSESLTTLISSFNRGKKQSFVENLVLHSLGWWDFLVSSNEEVQDWIFHFFNVFPRLFQPPDKSLVHTVVSFCEILILVKINYLFLNLIFQKEMQSKAENDEMGYGNHSGVCAICLNKIVLRETALVKGCEHAYWFVWSKSLNHLAVMLQILKVLLLLMILAFSLCETVQFDSLLVPFKEQGAHENVRREIPRICPIGMYRVKLLVQV